MTKQMTPQKYRSVRVQHTPIHTNIHNVTNRSCPMCRSLLTKYAAPHIACGKAETCGGAHNHKTHTRRRISTKLYINHIGYSTYLLYKFG